MGPGVAAVLTLLVPQPQPRELRLHQEILIGSSAVDTTLPDRITSIEVGRDGTIFVLSPMLPGILAFDVRGRFRRRIGRQGRGPGEFERPASMGWRGDTLWVQDQSLRRLQFFLPDGRLARVENPPKWGPLVPLIDGSYFVVRGVPLDAVSHPIVRVSPDLARVDTLAVLRWQAQPQISIPHNSGFIVGSAPFTDRARWAVAPRGDAIYLVEPDPRPSERSGTVRIRVLEASGRPRFEKRIPYTPVRLGDRRFEAAVVELADGHGGAGRLPRDAVRKAISRPRFLPALAAILVATNGDLWLRWSQDSDVTPSQWTVLGRNGESRGSFRFPGGIEPIRVHELLVFAVRRTVDDLPELIRYRMEGFP